MNKVKLFTDSTSDLTPELIKKFDISVVPLYVTFNEEAFRDGIDITTEKLFREIQRNGKLPKTSAPSPSDFYNAFQSYINDGFDILYIGLSSELSSTIQNARIAALDLPQDRIEIINSLNLSTGIGLLVLKAADYIHEGLSLHEIKEKLKGWVSRIKTSFVIDTLDYLYLGGRCSALQSFFGGILKIKPVVQVTDGKLLLADKIRGKREKALTTLLNNALKDKDTMDAERIMITHSQCYDAAVQLKEQLESALTVKEVIITDAGCVISSHCGPNTVGILYLLK